MLEAIKQPVGPLPAWGWGVVVVGGYFGYRILSGKGLSGGGSSSGGAASVIPNATGGITQGPQGDPGPVGPPGATGATGAAGGGTTATTTGRGAGHTPIGNFLTTLDAHQLHLYRIHSLSKTDLDAHQIHLGVLAKYKFAASPSHPAALIGSSILAPTTTKEAQPVAAPAIAHPVPTSAVTISGQNVPASTMAIRTA